MSHIDYRKEESKFYNVTPAIASELLKLNADNRPLRKTRVKDLSEEMTAGRWVATHQGFAISKDGRLLDGQHRLSAVVLSGKTMPFLITTGLHENAFKVLDIGLKRNLSDLTGYDRRLSDILSYTIKICFGKVANADLAEKIYPFIEPHYQEMISYCGTAAKKTSQAGTRLACIVSLINSKTDADKIHILNTYRNMNLRNFVHFTKIMEAFYKQIIENDKSSRDHDLLARSMVLFDPSKKNNSKIQVTNEVKKRYSSLVRNTIINGIKS